MLLYTPLGGSWLNMAESIQRILVRRALAGQHPRSPEEIIAWLDIVDPRICTVRRAEFSRITA